MQGRLGQWRIFSQNPTYFISVGVIEVKGGRIIIDRGRFFRVQDTGEQLQLKRMDPATVKKIEKAESVDEQGGLLQKIYKVFS